MMPRQTTRHAGPALLPLRWMALALEVAALGGYVYINISWGGQPWVVAAYLALLPSIGLDVFGIVTFALMPNPLAAILELVLLVLTTMAFIFLVSTFGIGWPEHPPWLGLGYFIAYGLMALLIVRLIFVILRLRYLYQLVVSSFHAKRSGTEEQRTDERAPLIEN